MPRKGYITRNMYKQKSEQLEDELDNLKERMEPLIRLEQDAELLTQMESKLMEYRGMNIPEDEPVIVSIAWVNIPGVYRKMTDTRIWMRSISIQYIQGKIAMNAFELAMSHMVSLWCGTIKESESRAHAIREELDGIVLRMKDGRHLEHSHFDEIQRIINSAITAQ